MKDAAAGTIFFFIVKDRNASASDMAELGPSDMAVSIKIFTHHIFPCNKCGKMQRE